MTKTELWTSVVNTIIDNEELFKKGKSNEFLELLKPLLEPKSGGGTINPPKETEEGTMYYCRFHKQYELQEHMVMSQGKSKGYCKASISKWNKTNSTIKKLNSQSVELMAQDNFEEAKTIAQEVQELKNNLNNPEFYDYEQDWLDFEKQ